MLETVSTFSEQDRMPFTNLDNRRFQKGLGWSVEETQVLLAKVRADIKNLKYHAYYPL